MSPDADVIATRLRLMHELLADLDSVGPLDARRLRDERLTRHAVERILTQLVDLSSSINAHVVSTLTGAAPATYRESFQALAEVHVIDDELASRLAPSAGMRNVLTHEYVDIDLTLVAAAAATARLDFADYIAAVARSFAD